MRRPWSTLVLIIALALFAVAVVRPNGEISFYGWRRSYAISQGLDLQGGLHLKYKLDLSQIAADQQVEAIRGVRDVMEKRVNPLGVAEPIIQTSRVANDAVLIIELPGQKDAAAAISRIGETAKLTFREQIGENQDFVETDLTGADLRPNGSQVSFNPNNRQPIINLSFTTEGGGKFGEITTRNVGKPIAIYLDDAPMQIATVRQAITGGQAEISGSFTLPEAQQTVRLLNAGALPVPLKLIEQQEIGASLGQESIERSLIAGGLGLLLVALFMMFYYRLMGIVAVVALSLYTLITLAIFKMVPVTLTLAGITGFILSIGMAVDANILIFERFKEEARLGKEIRVALSEGFARAWSSIRDSNASSIITALILYNFGASSLIKGFSLTLIIGILVSLFTAITVSRTLLYLVIGLPGLTGATAPTDTVDPGKSETRQKWSVSRSGRW